ncbi:unnamed protein product, partial [Prorocentrum cordatum]
PTYSFLEAGATCHEVGLDDVPSSAECFGGAAGSAGLGGVATLYIATPTVGFSCIYDTALDMVVFALAAGSGTQAGPSWRYICPGTFTTTVSSTVSATASGTTISATTASVTSATEGPGYSLLQPGQTCHELGLDDISSSSNCFGSAAPAVGVTSSFQTYLPGQALKISCVYDANSDTLFFSESTGAGTEGSSQYQFVCLGTYTSTETSTATATASATTVTATTVTTTMSSSATSLLTTTSATTTSHQDYTLLPAGQTCYEAGMQDVTSPAECFGPARASAGLSSAQTQSFEGFGFTFTCVHRSSSNAVQFADSSSADAEPSSGYQYICIGILTTSDSSTTTTSTSATTSTSMTTTETSSRTAVSETTSSETSSSTLTSTSLTNSTSTNVVATTTSHEDYTLLSAGQTCYEAGMQDVTNPSECFGSAMASVGLSPAQTQSFEGFGFAFTCVHSSSSNAVYFADSSSADAQPNSGYQYICIGILTTSDSSTTTISTSATTGTSMTSIVTSSTSLPPTSSTTASSANGISSASETSSMTRTSVSSTTEITTTSITSTTIIVETTEAAIATAPEESTSAVDTIVDTITISSSATTSLTATATMPGLSANSPINDSTTLTTSGMTYSLLEGGTSCYEVGLSDVSSSAECFGSASSSAGLHSVATIYIATPSVGFSCIYETSLNMVVFALAAGSDTQTEPSWRYICPGTFTTTVSSTVSTTASGTTISATTASVTSATEGPGYSLLQPGQTCHELGLDDISSSSDCFDSAAPAVGVTSSVQTYLPGTTFKVSCVFDAASNLLVFSESTGAGTEGSSQYQFVCLGTYTSTETSTATATASATTVTATTVTTTMSSSATSLLTTTSATTTSHQDYTLLPAGQTCYEAGMQDVTSPAECFGPARASAGLSSAQTQSFEGFGFTFTCVHRSSSNAVQFADSSSADAEPSSGYQYICIGILTTSDSSTTTTSTSATTSTSMTTTETSSRTAVSETTSSETSSSTLTSTSLTNSTSTNVVATTTSHEDYTLLSAGQTCYEAGMQDVTNPSECFGSAMASVGLSPAQTQSFEGFGFAFTCVHRSSSNAVYFADSSSADA